MGHALDDDDEGQSPPEAESIWPHSSDDSKQGKQTLTTAITTTTRIVMMKLL